MQGEMGGMEKIQLTNEKLIGNGSFGVVVQVRRPPDWKPLGT